MTITPNFANILFYDWPKIRRYSNKKVVVIRTILESMLDYTCEDPLRKYYDGIDFTGDSFIFNPYKLLQAFHTGNQVDAANYLMAASYRNFANYQITGENTLPLKYLPQLKQSSLLDIRGTEIHFLLEN